MLGIIEEEFAEQQNVTINSSITAIKNQLKKGKNVANWLCKICVII